MKRSLRAMIPPVEYDLIHLVDIKTKNYIVNEINPDKFGDPRSLSDYLYVLLKEKNYGNQKK